MLFLTALRGGFLFEEIWEENFLMNTAVQNY